MNGDDLLVFYFYFYIPLLLTEMFFIESADLLALLFNVSDYSLTILPITPELLPLLFTTCPIFFFAVLY